MNTRTISLAALVLASGALAAGCGSSDSSTSSSSSSTTAALSKAEFIKQADAICTKGNQAINAAQKKAFGPGKPSKSQVEQFVNDALIPSIQTQISGVKALPAPAGDEATVTKMLDDSQAALDKAKQDPSALLSGGGPFAQANQELKAYGLKVCGQS
jgi:hypothetical protein